MSSEPDAYPVAYCAPGKRFAAALTLMLKGEQVARIEEHLWLKDSADVIVIREPLGAALSAMSPVLAYGSLPPLPVPPWTPVTGV